MDGLHWKTATPEERKAEMNSAERSLAAFSSMSADEILRDMERMIRKRNEENRK
jgi:hypothetical protein